MASYLVMTPPGQKSAPDDVRFVRDGFSWGALVLPLVWMLFHRMWLYALCLLALELAVGLVLDMWGNDVASTLVLLALNLLIALESGEIRRRYFASKGFVIDRIVSAGSLDEAETIYFDGMDTQAATPGSAYQSASQGRGNAVPALGLFEPYKGR